MPWERFGPQTPGDTERSIEAIEGKKLAGGGGSVGITYKGVGVKAKWSFGVKAEGVRGDVNFTRPPGILKASASEIAFAAPLSGGWRIGYQSFLVPYAWVKVAGHKIWQKEERIPFAIRLEDIRLVARGDLNSTEADRPRLVKATLSLSMRPAGFGPLPPLIPVELKATIKQGRVRLAGELGDLSLGNFGGFANPKFTGHLELVLEPADKLDLDTSLLDWKTPMMTLTAKLVGKLSLSFRYVGSESYSFEILSAPSARAGGGRACASSEADRPVPRLSLDQRLERAPAAAQPHGFRSGSAPPIPCSSTTSSI